MVRRTLIVLLAVVLSGCGTPQALSEYPITYQVAGRPGARALLMYTNAARELESVTDLTLPWSYSVTAPAHSYLSFSVTSLGDDLLTCVIAVNGIPFKKATTPRHGTADCGAQLP